MNRAIAFVVLALVLTAANGALAVVFELTAMPLVPGVLLCAYAALVDPPVEAAVTSALVGLVIDALSGTPLGVNVLACVGVLVASRFAVSWVASPRGLRSALFVGGFTMAYGLIALSLLFLFQRREAFGFGPLVVTAVANALASLALFPLLRRVLVTLRLEDKDETLQERLAKGSFLVGSGK